MKPTPQRASWLPWLLLLPLAPLAWPWAGSPMADNPIPHIAGAGWVALGSLPAALWLLRRGRARALSGLAPLLLLWAYVTAAVHSGSPSDPFEAERAWVHLGSFVVLFAAAAQLDTAGRRTLNRGLVLLSILWSAMALWMGAGEAYGGVLGNSGTLSQAALPGAAIGAWYVVTRRGLFWCMGLVAFALFLAHAGLAPVVAGGLGLMLTLLASSWLSPWARRKEQVRRRLGVLAALTIFSLIGLMGMERAASTPESPAPQTESSSPDHGDLGGARVRWLIWGSLPKLLAEHPIFGLGPGQFQAQYPPYRDPREAAASRGPDLNANETFVNHAHNDILQGFAELGLVAGLLWLTFLALMLRAALSGLSQLDFPTIASSAGALALLIAALFHAPLTMNPAAAATGAVLFGSVSGRLRAGRGLQPTRPWRLLLLAALLASLPSAWQEAQLGARFQALIRSNRALATCKAEGGGPKLNPLLVNSIRARQKAIEAAPQSAPARFAAARASVGMAREDAWNQALEVRPHSVEALEQLGLLAARRDRIAAARDAWSRALELSPEQPRILENFARLELLHGDLEHGASLVKRRLALGPLREGLDSYFGAQLVLRGALMAGTPLLTGQALGETDPIQINADYQRLRKTGPELQADALRTLSQWLWAREHVAAGNLAQAQRTYGQALRPTRKLDPNGAPPLRAEIAALALLMQDLKTAHLEALGLRLSAAQWQALPAWAREALRTADLPAPP